MRNFLSPESGTKFQKKVPLFWSYPNFLITRVNDEWKEAPMTKTSSIRSAVSIERRLVTDRHTDRQTRTDGHTRSLLRYEMLF